MMLPGGAGNRRGKSHGGRGGAPFGDASRGAKDRKPPRPLFGDESGGKKDRNAPRALFGDESRVQKDRKPPRSFKPNNGDGPIGKAPSGPRATRAAPTTNASAQQRKPGNSSRSGDMARSVITSVVTKNAEEQSKTLSVAERTREPIRPRHGFGFPISFRAPDPSKIESRYHTVSYLCPPCIEEPCQ